MKHSVLLPLLLTVSLAANARTPVRPYEEWEATQFVALSGHQPSDYVAPDNNWEILYCLRTPHTPAELRATGVGCTDSQLMLLEVGGLIAEQEGKWKTTIPILDREQTRSLRSFADGVAESVYTANEADFVNLAGTIREAGFGNNVFSLLFCWKQIQCCIISNRHIMEIPGETTSLSDDHIQEFIRCNRFNVLSGITD